MFGWHMGKGDKVQGQVLLNEMLGEQQGLQVQVEGVPIGGRAA